MKKQRLLKLALKKVCIAHLNKPVQTRDRKAKETFFELCTLEVTIVTKQ